jgi:hypothetical protein
MGTNVIQSFRPETEKIIFQGKLKKEVKREERVKYYLNKESEAKSFRAWLSSRKALATLNQDKETFAAAFQSAIASKVTDALEVKKVEIKPVEKVEIKPIEKPRVIKVPSASPVAA